MENVAVHDKKRGVLAPVNMPGYVQVIWYLFVGKGNLGACIPTK